MKVWVGEASRGDWEGTGGGQRMEAGSMRSLEREAWGWGQLGAWARKRLGQLWGREARRQDPHRLGGAPLSSTQDVSAWSRGSHYQRLGISCGLGGAQGSGANGGSVRQVARSEGTN